MENEYGRMIARMLGGDSRHCCTESELYVLRWVSVLVCASLTTVSTPDVSSYLNNNSIFLIKSRLHNRNRVQVTDIVFFG